MCSLDGNTDFRFLMSNTMCARAVLTCRPNSHPFQDRSLPLDQPIKIGRSVARARPSPGNAIFDCKVLSRNHALLWYETDNGKFYLQDTKSSNGTFVNNQRLSKSSEESPPRELCSGDIVQFGVDVMEVNKKLTHGCIIANVQLFLPDGKEAKASSSTIVPEKATSTPVQDIYLLNQYLKEAMLREQVLENKLAIMTKHLAGTNEFMEQNWKALIEEDRLLTRVDILERQLQACHKSMTEDKLREEVVQLLQDKEKYQNVAKDALRKAMHEKLEISKKFKDTERGLQEMESTKIGLEEMCERNFKDLKELAEKYEEAEQSKKDLTEEMNLSTQKYKDDLESLNLKIKEKEVALNDNKSSISELERMLKTTESEKKEILAKLNQLLDLFEDLKAVSNKVQVSEYVIEKLDIEIKQIKDFTIEETVKNDLDEAVKKNNVEDSVKKNHFEDIHTLEKLLEESREKVKSLQNDNLAAEQENGDLRRQLEDYTFQLSDYMTKMEELAARNDELAADRNKWEKEVESLKEQTNNNSGLQSRMIELEEELAVYKDRYNECSNNCTSLSRKYAELNEEHQTLVKSKSVNLLIAIPLIILILAVLIASRPSS